MGASFHHDWNIKPNASRLGRRSTIQIQRESMNPEHELQELDREWVAKSDERQSSVARGEKMAKWIWLSVMAGFGLVFLGLWMNDLGEDVRLERLLQPWMITATVLGVVLILALLVIGIRNGRKIGATHLARLDYELRRDELIRAIHDDSD